MLDELGIELKKARELRGVSLQAIAEPAKISVAYLQKLEGGHVGSPSPRVLRRVGSSVGLPYLRLMDLAGIGKRSCFFMASWPRAATNRFGVLTAMHAGFNYLLALNLC